MWTLRESLTYIFLLKNYAEPTSYRHTPVLIFIPNIYQPSTKYRTASRLSFYRSSTGFPFLRFRKSLKIWENLFKFLKMLSRIFAPRQIKNGISRFTCRQERDMLRIWEIIISALHNGQKCLKDISIRQVDSQRRTDLAA